MRSTQHHIQIEETYRKGGVAFFNEVRQMDHKPFYSKYKVQPHDPACQYAYIVIDGSTGRPTVILFEGKLTGVTIKENRIFIDRPLAEQAQVCDVLVDRYVRNERRIAIIQPDQVEPLAEYVTSLCGTVTPRMIAEWASAPGRAGYIAQEFLSNTNLK